MVKSSQELVGNCFKCHSPIFKGHPYGWCIKCGEPLPKEIVDFSAPVLDRKEKDLKKTALLNILMSTTPFIEGYRITQSLGIVGTEYVLGLNAFKDLVAGITDVTGGRSKGYQQALGSARHVCIEELKEAALALEADAVCGVSFSYSEISGGGKSMLLVAAHGTAVKLVRPT